MTLTQTTAQVVSSEQERLILVDDDDNEVGTLDKSACHNAGGVLHRAFSLFVFNPDGQLLIQQRHPDKRLWGGYWSNSCCSHPRAGEDMDTAVARRLHQELGICAELEFLYKFVYRAEFGTLGTEHELCWVYVGQTDATPVVNTTEVADWRWIDQAGLDARLGREHDQFTPWFEMEWARLRGDYRSRLPS